jgi:dimeric dUTPase (all-alpha-NTP-PPase superfamily)
MGLKKLEIGEFLKAKYPGILEAKINIFPFWRNKIPLNADKIKIEYVDSL